MVLDGGQHRDRRKVGGVQEQALDATFSLVQPVDQRLGFVSLLLGDVQVHDILGSVLQLAQLLFKTCISRQWNQSRDQPQHVGLLSKNKQDANPAGSLWTSP
jgi:hypothetical protein